MERFAYDLKNPKESIDDFNARISDFCGGTPVVDVQANIDLRGVLLLSITTAEDLVVAQATCQIPHIVLLSDQDYAAGLEERLETVAKAILDTSSPQVPRIPMAQQIIEREGFASVLLTRINCGIYINEDMTGEGEGE